MDKESIGLESIGWDVSISIGRFNKEEVLLEKDKAQDKLQKIPVTEAEKAYQESYDYWEKNKSAVGFLVINK